MSAGVMTLLNPYLPSRQSSSFYVKMVSFKPRCNVAALLGISAGDEDGLVLQPLWSADQLLEWRVRLDKVVHGELNAKLGAQILDSIRLVLAASVGQQDEGDVVVLEILQRLSRTRDGFGHVK